MAYLDVSPMIGALRARPQEFEMNDGWLHHIPSRHSFNFDESGRLRLLAPCDCSFLMVQPEQERSLFDHYKQWHADYWRPVEINRRFASHFDPPSPLRRVLIALTGALHRAVLHQGHAAHRPAPADMGAKVGAA